MRFVIQILPGKAEVCPSSPISRGVGCAADTRRKIRSIVDSVQLLSRRCGAADQARCDPPGTERVLRARSRLVPSLSSSAEDGRK